MTYLKESCDRKPIVKAIKKPGGGESQKQRRWLRDISEETSDIQHVEGKRNVVADTLRLPFSDPAEIHFPPIFFVTLLGPTM